ncbi:MAG: type VI secretion system-associated protein TagF [Caulobacteraceae bacterium]|nr:type VI secretion system-associated protein TagF [Caulobacter sp.]
MSAASAPLCGLFGKTPDAGDFLRLNLQPELAIAMDAWAQEELARLAAEGVEASGAGACWRFVTTPRAMAGGPFAGVAAPSRDKVGRGFLCCVVAPLAGLEAQAAVACTPWFDAAEGVLEAARAGGRGREALGADLADLGAPGEDDLDVLSLRGRSTDDGLFLDVRSGPDGRATTLQAVLASVPLPEGSTLWWRHVEAGAKALVAPGLPSGVAFAALFAPGEAAQDEGATP